MNATGSVLVDTSVVVAHFRGDPGLTAHLRGTAALAREYQFPVATRDQHFALVPGLTVLAW